MAPHKRRARTGRLAFLAATVAASAVLATGGQAVGAGVADPPVPVPGSAMTTRPTPAAGVVTPVAPVAPQTPVPPVNPEPPKSPPPESPEPPEVPRLPAFGAYVGYDGARGTARIGELSRWLGNADLKVGHTYLPGDRWSNIEGLPGFLDVWADWRRAEEDRLFVLNVPMLERNEDGVSDRRVQVRLRRGAAGFYDHHFRALAERLVELKIPDTVIVLGWEMNGITYTHRCGPDPEAWKRYWNRIVTTMRAVPGQKFRFDFNPTRGKDAIPWPQCYPGDDTVDIIGMDAYDQPQGLSFDEQVNEPYGLQAHVDFAKAHGKAISYPEWGLFRNGDNPEYMRRMLAWIDKHKPLYNTLTDYCPHGVWLCGSNPKASQVYRQALTGRKDTQSTVPTPNPNPTPQPPTPTDPVTPPVPLPPPNCSPVELGDWVEYWLGGRLCLRFDWWSRN
ncbi:glycosyl hydrolase [Streptomyces sp. ME02-8801-2C]|uniref:glycoside hydrolase family 26 protein n=1 Tax=Streptomyces sp. ME02-8801-2C TaxID=3028680 RepID=UPI0029A060E0|nr:glycosyl hydrolase [Streptomyces sp. ME02-8801-2C]MDX3454733.1 glycosyl hydrolase [Streptomyces sp. ME02-8801-2C]